MPAVLVTMYVVVNELITLQEEFPVSGQIKLCYFLLYCILFYSIPFYIQCATLNMCSAIHGSSPLGGAAVRYMTTSKCPEVTSGGAKLRYFVSSDSGRGDEISLPTSRKISS